MDTICNCFIKALSLRESTTIPSHDQGLIRDIEHGLQGLEQENNIQQATDISQFLNPADEQAHNSLMSIDDAIIGQFPAADDEEQEEDGNNGHILPQIFALEALEALYKVWLHEEQQEDANQDLIQLLWHHEWVLFRRRQARQQHNDIQNYF